MNYIKHLTGFFDRVVQDRHLNPTHISLYIGLFQYWNINRFQNPISITRDEIMRISKICSKATYHKCMRELNDKGYIKYEPSYNPFKGSMVILFNFSDDLKPTQKKETTSSKILPFDEQAVNKLCTSSGTGAEHAIGIFYKHNTNISNISNNLNLSKHEKNFKNEKSNVLEEEEEKSSAKKEEEKEMPEQSVDEQKYSPSLAFADYSAERTENGRQKSSAKKEKKISSPNQDDVKHFFQSQKFPELEAQKFYNYFSSNGWLVGGKTPMVNWKAAAHNWMLNFDKFNPAESQPNRTNHLTTTTDKDYSEPL